MLLNVNVDTAGRARLSAAPGETIDNPDTLKDRLVVLHDQFKSNGQAIDTVEVVLRPTRGTTWAKLAPFYDAALRAKFEKVSFAAAGG